MRILETLLSLLFPTRATAALTRETNLETIGLHLSSRSISIGQSEITALLPYRTPLVRALIVEAKYHEHAKAHELLGSILAEYLQSLLEDSAFGSAHFVLVPIPLSKQRFRERGYNQAERIARRALDELPDEFTLAQRLMGRVRDTRPQTELGRTAREQNMRGAFAVRETVYPASTYIVIDDVLTTGATLRAAEEALRAAGATEVRMVALAH